LNEVRQIKVYEVSRNGLSNLIDKTRNIRRKTLESASYLNVITQAYVFTHKALYITIACISNKRAKYNASQSSVVYSKIIKLKRTV